MTLEFSRDWFIQMKRGDISTLDGWYDFVNRRKHYHPPPLLTRQQRSSMDSRDCFRYDVARRMASANLPQHETAATMSIRDGLEPVLQANLYSCEPGVRGGLFVSGDGGVGKSTVIREILAAFDNEVRGIEEIAPGLISYHDRWVPVAWVTVPPKLTIRNLSKAILNFYAAPYRDSDTDDKLTKRAADTIRDCGTVALCLDDISRYKDKEADRYALDWIRNLMETSVTVVAMGVDVRSTGILYDGRSRLMERLSTQTGTRFPVLDMDPFSYDSKEGIRNWVSHLKAVEDDLLLLDKFPGMLSAELPEFLFEHTKGVIGVLARWTSVTSMKAVGRAARSGGEELTRKDFERTPVPKVEELKDDLNPFEPPRKKPRRRRDNSMYDQPPRQRDRAK